MPANTSPLFELTPNISGNTFVNADGTTIKDLWTAGANGGRIDMVSICSNDTAAVNLAFYINDGATDFYIGNVNVPIGSGYTTVVRVDALYQLAAVAGYLLLANGYKLRANAVAAVTAAKTVTVVVMGGDF